MQKVLWIKKYSCVLALDKLNLNKIGKQSNYNSEISKSYVDCQQMILKSET